jgi:hypothetical protein
VILGVRAVSGSRSAVPRHPVAATAPSRIDGGCAACAELAHQHRDQEA